MIWMAIFLTGCHTFIFEVSSQNLVLHRTISPSWWVIFYSHHLPGWQRVDNLRRNYILITPWSERANSILSKDLEVNMIIGGSRPSDNCEAHFRALDSSWNEISRRLGPTDLGLGETNMGQGVGVIRGVVRVPQAHSIDTPLATWYTWSP